MSVPSPRAVALGLLLSVVGFVLVGCGGGDAPAPIADPAPAPVPSAPAAGPQQAGEARPAKPAGDFPPEHPRWKQIQRATSSDGVHWEPMEGVLALDASSPQAVVVNGELRVLFVSGGRKLAWVDFDGGQPVPIKLRGQGPGQRVDPHLQALPEGGYRLFYIFQRQRGDPGAGAHNEVRSALSPDGDRWELEEGVRIEGVFVDPDLVALPDGGVRMFLTRNAREVLSARSDDGLSFALEPGLRFEGGGVTSTLAHAGGWWMYYADGGMLGLARSDCGLSFQRAEVLTFPSEGSAEPELRESPSVVRHGDRWYMAYVVAAR